MSVSRDFCPRFVDYIVLVGSHSSNRTSYAVQNPVILNRFPPLDHDDFILPPDVALFCQPDGCYNSCGPHAPKIPHQSLPGRSPVSFVFTITDKESSKTRYGICLNFMRPIRRRRGSRKQSTSLIEDQLKAKFQRSAVNTGTNSHSSCLEDNTRMSISNDSSKGKHVSRLRTHTLTSLCIITHHPFFSKFRAVLEFLQKLIQKVHERSRSEVPEGESIWGVLTGAITSVSSPLVARSVREIEVWILKLLSAPAPIPGRTCLHLSLQPKSLSDPLVFALPDKSRLPLVDFPLHLPIQLMGISRTLRILVCLLLEQKVVLQSADYNKLSLCVLAFTALLYPLQYMFPVIPLLPPCMADAEQLLIAPTPYIIGVPTSFYSARKVFRMPKDVWLANLDTQELSYPEVLEEIPDLPEPECNNLIKQLNHALSTLPSVSSDTSLDLALYQVNQLFRNPAVKSLTGYNPLSYISDEASTSVATRVSMVLFLLTKNILGGLSEYTRTLRLYPRPVVAFQFERFMRSRPRPCLFTSMLAKTQAVEYFAECSLCSQNEAYQRIEAGDYTPELIGDKAEWFSSFLQNVHFDVWPDSTADSPSNFGRLNTCAGSPLLYALVAARLQYNSQFASPENSDAVGVSSGDLKLDVTRDDLSDYPTDESASDTETEHSTASIGSTLSDVTSDCVDSGIGEPQNKGNDAGVRLNITIVRTDSVVSARRDSDPSVAEQLFVRAGEPLPSSLADYFNPPLAPVLNKLPSVKGNEIIVCIPAMQGSDHSANELEVDKEDIISTTSDAKSDSSRSFKPSTPSTEQTLRAVARISANMFNASSNRNSDGDRANPSVLSDGGINWNSSLFKLVNELLHLNATDQSAELERALSKRLSDETYLIHVARAIKAGNTPSIFSRGRLCSMLEYEEYRNLLLARLNLSRANTAVGTISSVQQSSLMIDVPVESWSQYKALVWILRQITQGLDVSLRSDVFIPTPTNVHSEAYMTSRNRSTPVNEESARGGLASAFVLLEIAHTHYYQLPARNERGFFTFGRASLGSLDSGKLRSSESRPVSPVTTEEGQDSNRGPENNQLSVNQENNVTNTTCSDGESLTPGLSEPKLDPRIRTSSLNSNPTVRASSSSGAQKRILASRPPVPRRSRGSSSHSQCPEVHESSDSNTVFEVPSEPSSMRSLTPEPYSSMRVPLFDESDDSGLTTNKSSQSHGYRYHRSRLLTPDTTIPDDMRSLPFNLRYRRSLGEVHYLHPSSSSPGINARGVDGRVKVGRTFVFEDLTNGNQTKSGVWNNLQFWEDAFLDAVAQERDMLGMDFRPGDLLARYNSASPLKRKHAELEEDRLLAGLMHNLIAFMVMMGVERTDIRRKIRRLLAKSHMGLHYSQEISNLLDVLDFLYGNDVDLKTLQSRATSHRAYEVYRGTDKSGELLFIEVGCECLLIRNLAGFILDRWWYDQMINVTYRKPKNILSVSIQINQKPTSHLFYTSKGEVLYLAIQKAMEQVSIDSRRGPLGGDLNGELNVINLENGSSGVIKITPDGFYMKFNQKEMFVRISHVKRCSAPQHDIFTIEYFDATEKCLLVRNLRTDMALLMLNFWQRMLMVAISRRQFIAGLHSTPKH